MLRKISINVDVDDKSGENAKRRKLHKQTHIRNIFESYNCRKLEEDNVEQRDTFAFSVSLSLSLPLLLAYFFPGRPAWVGQSCIVRFPTVGIGRILERGVRAGRAQRNVRQRG